MELSKGRDMRKRGWFWLDDEYLNGYAKHLGTTATCVYLCLCRHVDKDQTCFPKLETIAKEIGSAKNTVITAIKKLQKWGIIEIKKEYDFENKKQKVNVYLLTDKNYWLPKPEQSAIIEPSIPECKKSDEQGANNEQSRVQPLHCKETQFKETHNKYTTQSVGTSGVVIDLFKIVNPSYQVLFKRKPQHDASKRLLEREGIEKLIKVVDFLRIRRGDKFCPQISTPIQLEEKWSALEKYAMGIKNDINKYKVAF